jgi:hypothetical protein
MINYINYNSLIKHVNHKIVIKFYAGYSKDQSSNFKQWISLECMTCLEILLELDHKEDTLIAGDE